MIPGHQALGGIEQGLAQLRAEETDATRRLDDATRRLAEARATETEAYRDLAAFRMKTQDGLGSLLGKAATQVRALLAMRASDRQTMDRELAAAEAEVKRVSDERLAFAAQLQEAEEARRAVENQAGVGLSADDAYVKLRAEAETAWRVAEEAEKKAKIAEDELAAKRVPYETDALFQYLWKRGHGTSAYEAGNIARMLDNWVARLIRYQDARPNYAMLNEIPTRLRAHANATRAKSVDLIERLKAVEKDAFAKAGGTKADGKVADLNARLAALDKAREAADARQAKALAAIDAFGRGEDPRYREAVGLLAENLRGEDTRRLYNAALATPQPDDDALVRGIGQSRDAQVGLDDEIKRIRGELAAISRRRQEVGQVAEGFRRRRYDTDGSYFDDDVVRGLLRGVMTGILTGADYWSRMERSRRWNRPAPQQQGPMGGTIFLPFPTGDWGGGAPGGNWGGGTWGGGGGGWGGGGGGGGVGDGDGFKTGGSF